MLFAENSVNAAWSKQRVSVLDSWSISVTYRQGLSKYSRSGCFVFCSPGAKGQGFAIVVQDQAIDALGAGELGCLV